MTRKDPAEPFVGTDLTKGTADDLPFDYEPTPPNPAAPKPRKCYRHDWTVQWIGDAAVDCCKRCGHQRDLLATRRGKSSRRLGADQERRIERVYGPTKIGERGDPVDHLGKLGRWQSKATRGPVPRWLSEPMRKMDRLYGDRISILILSFVAQGKPTEDYVVVSGKDWLALHGRDEEFELKPDPYLEEQR